MATPNQQNPQADKAAPVQKEKANQRDRQPERDQAAPDDTGCGCGK